ncbi:oligosaccharide flippase family protein [Adlercreutzia sp. ZJ141]|uniref:oligosaccharide flippase family protein n=1 Tax=Adlercreutzia sp. ZJ141 TaxID=2709406 RepID=UPI0013EC1810|nr:oligosaccharide flippase family protein [Adlercreutzia sp. ZJ141]
MGGIARVGSALGYNIAGLCASKGAVFIAQVLASRILGATLYGQASIVVNTTAVFATMAALGLGVLTTRFAAELRDSDKDRLNRILGMSAAVGLVSSVSFAGVLFAAADAIAQSQLGSSSMAPYLRVAAVTLAFSTYNGIQRGTLVGLERFRQVMTVDIVSGMANIIFCPVAAILWGVDGYIVALAVVAVVTNLAYWVSVRRGLRRFSLRFDLKGAKSELRLLGSFALPTMLAGVLVGPVNWVCGVLLINLPAGYAEYGLYSAAFQWRTMVTTVLGAFGNAMLPILIAAKDSDESIERLSMLTEWIVAIVISALIVPFSGVLTVLYGETYDAKSFSDCMTALMASCVVGSYLNGVNRKVIQRQKMWTAFVGNLIWAIATIFCTVAFLSLGAVGLACAVLAGYAIMLTFMLAVLYYQGAFDMGMLFNVRVGSVWVLLVAWMALSFLADSVALKLLASSVLLIGVVKAFDLVRLARKLLSAILDRRTL